MAEMQDAGGNGVANTLEGDQNWGSPRLSRVLVKRDAGRVDDIVGVIPQYERDRSATSLPTDELDELVGREPSTRASWRGDLAN